MKKATDPFKLANGMTAKIRQDAKGEPCSIDVECSNGSKTAVTMQDVAKLAVKRLQGDLAAFLRKMTQKQGAE